MTVIAKRWHSKRGLSYERQMPMVTPKKMENKTH
jgi:hypothetical protein